MKPIVEIESLKVIKGGRAICHIPELTVAPGERVGLVGANGSGKSTLLRVLGALESDFTGECRIAAGRRDRLYVHQSPCLFRGSVLFNTAYGLAARGISRSDRRRIAGRWLQRLGVDHLARRRCTRLSGGERRRVALARAFVLEPQLLLLDEPFAELDEQGISIVRGALAELTRSTLLIASPAALPEQVVQRVVEVEAII